MCGFCKRQLKYNTLSGETIDTTANAFVGWPVIRAYLADRMPIILTE